jgi:hypothetical protein
MDQEITNAKGKAFGDIGRGTALGAATLFTGGAAAPLAMGLMGAAGVGAEALDQTIKAGFGSTELPGSAREMVNRFGLEGALSAAGEGGARAIGQGLKYLGSEALPSLAMRSAAKAQEGQNILKRYQSDAFGKLREFVQSKGTTIHVASPDGLSTVPIQKAPAIDIGSALDDFYGAIGKRVTGESAAFKEAIKPVQAKLAMAGGGTLSKQPLDALMEIKTDLSAITYKAAGKGMNTEEFTALENLTKAVDAKISGELAKQGGPAARNLWKQYKDFSHQVLKDSGTMEMAETGLKKFLGKAAGYVPGVDSAIDDVIRSKAAPWVLEKAFSEPKTAELLRKAMALQDVGKPAQAQAIFDSIINTTDVGTLLKGYFNPQARKDLKDQFVGIAEMPPAGP